MDSIIGIEKCSVGEYVIFGIFLIICIFATWLAVRINKRE